MSARKRTAKSKSNRKPTPLDEETSAKVIGEYVALGKVTEGEIEAIENEATVDARGAALTFRVSEILGIPDAFEMAPRFQKPFAALRLVFGLARDALAETSGTATEAR